MKSARGATAILAAGGRDLKYVWNVPSHELLQRNYWTRNSRNNAIVFRPLRAIASHDLLHELWRQKKTIAVTPLAESTPSLNFQEGGGDSPRAPKVVLRKLGLLTPKSRIFDRISVERVKFRDPRKLKILPLIFGDNPPPSKPREANIKDFCRDMFEKKVCVHYPPSKNITGSFFCLGN